MTRWVRAGIFKSFHTKAIRMTTAKLLSHHEFDGVLTGAEARFRARIDRLAALKSAGTVGIFGYGGKGRTLAWQIAKGSDTKVVVYDSRPKVRELAATEGFATVDSVRDLEGRGFGVILGACQAQMEQAAVVPDDHIYYQEAAYLFDAPHLANKAREFSTWIAANKETLYRTYTAVHAQSRASLLGVLSFRLSLDPRDLTACRKPNSDMWFDVPEQHATRRYTTLLDVGAYDGDTLAQAQRRLAVTRGIAVEANTALFDAIGRIASSYEGGIKIMAKAAWSHACRLHFAEVRGGMISVSEAEDGELEAGPIDDGIDETVDLIKMDIEGAEMSALSGCKRTLKTGPDLAIAAYHRPADLVELPSFLNAAGYASPAFDLHVAHYSDCLDDTIIYYLKSQ